MSILMIGGTGMVGGEVAFALARRGLQVSALVRGGRNHPRSGNLIDAGIRVLEGDLCQPHTLTHAMSDIETVICSATSMPSAPNDGIRTVDHDGTLALIDAAESKGVKKFVYISYSGNIRLDSPLERAKRDCESRLLASEMQCVILRPSFFMEVWLSPMLGFDPANGTARVYGQGQSKVSYISSSNVADFAVSVATTELGDKTNILELGGPEALSQLDVVRLFEQKLEKAIRVDHVPVDALQAQLQSPDPLQKTFAALMLGYSGGDVVQDAVQNARRHQVELRTIAEYASTFARQTPVPSEAK